MLVPPFNVNEGKSNSTGVVARTLTSPSNVNIVSQRYGHRCAPVERGYPVEFSLGPSVHISGCGKKKGGEEGASRGGRRNGRKKGKFCGGMEGEQSRYKKGGGSGIACYVAFHLHHIVIKAFHMYIPDLVGQLGVFYTLAGCPTFPIARPVSVHNCTVNCEGACPPSGKALLVACPGVASLEGGSGTRHVLEAVATGTMSEAWSLFPW